MRWLDGHELADFIKARQAVRVRSLKAHKIPIRLLYTGQATIFSAELKLYAQDLTIDFLNDSAGQKEDESAITNQENSKYQIGLIANEGSRIPASLDQQNSLLWLNGPEYDPALASAIIWLLTGYDILNKTSRLFIIGTEHPLYTNLCQISMTSGWKLDKATTIDLTKLKKNDIIIELGIKNQPLLDPTAIPAKVSLLTISETTRVTDAQLQQSQLKAYGCSPDGAEALVVPVLIERLLNALERPKPLYKLP